jgi:TP901 family phage tail tape measure protein
MPLGVREVLLVVRAQESATGVLSNLATSFRKLNKQQQAAANAQIKQGKALVAVGVGIAAVGAAGIKFMVDNTKAAIDYNKQVAYTKTQMQGVKGTMDQVANVGLTVAKNIPVAFDSIQGGLYDIFSSMDVNLAQSKVLLTSFSKAAVAGQVSLQDSGRATIGIMNAYHLSIDQVNNVNDVMFELVRKGVGTYADFARVIGLAIPSAAKAGESYKQLAGMMAFLTRNGLSASSAASAAARGLDAIVKVGQGGFQNIGKVIVNSLGLAGQKAAEFANRTVDIATAGGKLRPVTDIMKQMAKALGGLTDLQRSAVLKELFKNNGGTIQAFRFLMPASTTAGAKQLAALAGDMENAKGATQAAFNVMKNTPAEKIAQLSNDWKVFRVELGNGLLPVLGKLAGFFGAIVGWMDKLSARDVKIIGWVIAVTSVLITLTGIVIAVAGAIAILGAVLGGVELLGAPILVTVGLIVAAVVALAVAAFFVIKYWQPISTWFHNMWFDMWHWINSVWQMIVKFLTTTWSDITKSFTIAMNFIRRIWNDIWSWMVTALKVFLTILLLPFVAFWLIFRKPITDFWNWIHPFVSAGWTKLIGIWNGFTGALRNGWNAIWKYITTWTKTEWDVVRSIFTGAIHAVEVSWDSFWNGLKGAATATWKFIVRGWDVSFWNPIKAGFKSAVHILSSLWDGIERAMGSPINWVIQHVWNDGIVKVWNVAAGITGAPKLHDASLLKFAEGAIVNKPTMGVFGEAGPEMILPLSKPKRMMELLGSIMPMHAGGGIFGSIGGVISGIGNWISSGVKGLEAKILGPVEHLVESIPGSGLFTTYLVDAGKKIIDGLVNKITSAAKNFVSTSGGPGMPGPGGGAPAANAALARRLYPPWGSGGQWIAWNNVAMRESGWNQFAQNASSGAYGIPQALPGSKMGAAANPPQSNPTAQIRWMVGYIKGRYGTPAGAWAHEQSAGWYRNGGYLPRGQWGIVGENGPEPIKVNNNGALIRPNRGGGAPQQNITIYTNEINPRQHAAELGWELARRSG